MAELLQDRKQRPKHISIGLNSRAVCENKGGVFFLLYKLKSLKQRFKL